MKIHIPQDHHTQNSHTADQQQDTGQVVPRIGPEISGAQQQGHDHLIAHHGGHRNGLHNHHAGGRRQAANEHKQGQPGLTRRQRQRQHEVVCICTPLPKIQQTTQGNGQHKQIDGQQVQGKHPHRTPQVALAHVFHHHHLKLARQKNHRQHGQQRQGKPLRPGKVAALLQAQKAGELGDCLRTGEHIPQAVEHAVHHEHTDRQKGDQLDHRLKGNGGHHALMALRGVQVARPENHGETSQRQGHVEGTVLAPVRRCGQADGGRSGQQGVACGNRLELQSDIGNDAHHSNQRDQTRKQVALAIAAANEIGNRCDAVGFGNANHLAHHQPAQHHGQRGAQVNGQKPDTARGRAPNAAKVSPGRAVHRH